LLDALLKVLGGVEQDRANALIGSQWLIVTLELAQDRLTRVGNRRW
jgi:hypothetical protein